MRSVRDITQELSAKSKEIAPLAQRFIEGGLDGSDLEAFRQLRGKIEELTAEKSDAERMDQEARSTLEWIDGMKQSAGRVSGIVPQESEQRGNDTQHASQYRTIGDAFAHSDQLDEFRSRLGMGTNSRAFRIGSLNPTHRDELRNAQNVAPEVRALMTSTTMTDLIQPQRIPGIITPDRAPLMVRDLFTNGTTQSNTVEFVKEGSRTNNAAEVAEATSLTTGLKPESGFTLTSDSVPVVTIAHIMYATRQALDDVGQLRMLIDQFLFRGIQERVDRQLLLGNGTSPNLRGLLATTGVQQANGAYWAANPLPSDANKWDRLRRMMTMVRINGRGRTSGMVLSPAALEEAAMAKDSNGNYLFPGGGPFGGGFQTLWGVPVTEQEDLDDNQVIVGDFARGAAVLDRMDAQIFVSDSNRDLFERNIITILGEARIAFPVFRPETFVNGDLEATGA